MKRLGLMAAVFGLLAFLPARTQAAVIVFDTCFTGDCTNVTGDVTVTITDNIVDPNDVDFLIENNTNGDLDYARFLAAVVPTGTAEISNYSTTGSASEPSVAFGAGTDAGEAYNVDVNFASGAAVRLESNESAFFTLGTSTGFNLNAADFTGALAHIISIAIGGNSAKLTTDGGDDLDGEDDEPADLQDDTPADINVPEPASLLLFATGLAMAGFGSRRRNRKV